MRQDVAAAAAANNDSIMTFSLESAESQSGFAVLDPGEEQVLSSWVPDLKGGNYRIEVAQTLTTQETDKTYDNKPLNLSTAEKPTTQTFEIVTPRYTLASDAIVSFYPPEGYGVQTETLPHIVFKDPHLPWARVGSEADSDPENPPNKSQVPWLALLVFSPDELMLQDQELNDASSGMFRNIPSMLASGNPIRQTSTQAVAVPATNIWDITNTLIPYAKDLQDPDLATTTVDMIFLKRPLFAELFRAYNQQGEPVQPQKNADVDRYRYLSHVRSINTEGMVGIDDNDEQSGIYSMIVSHRIGPFSTQPAPVVVHLVSIEDVENLDYASITAGEGYVGLASLQSWSYVTLPPGEFNVADIMRNLGDNLASLRAPDVQIARLRQQNNKNAQRVADRLNDGYTLARYRTQTGEETVTMMRGALAPNVVPYPIFDKISRSGVDLQIFDDVLGIMDTTYSLAWQLGKTLALADQGFCTALSRLRTFIHKFAENQAKEEHLRERQRYKSHVEMIKSIVPTIKTLGTLQAAKLDDSTDNSMLNRWQRNAQPLVDLSLKNDNIRAAFAQHADTASVKLASSIDEAEALYNELNKPYSTDWAIVLKWVLNKMYLYDIPAQYLIVDPAYLMPETLRFFHIDQNWVDALIDGALSIGNHLEEIFGNDLVDPIRLTIKNQIRRYFDTPIQGSDLKPRSPSWGFLMRSDLVSRFPNMKVAPDFVLDGKGRPSGSMLRHENLADDVMFCLFDKSPYADLNGTLNSITFIQPPHQKTFIAGETISNASFVTKYRRMYTNSLRPDDPASDYTDDGVWTPDTKPPVFMWGANNEIRTLILPTWTNDIWNNLTQRTGQYFAEDKPTAAMTAIQLNNPIYVLQIGKHTILDKISGGASPPFQGMSKPMRDILIANTVTASQVVTPPSISLPDPRKRRVSDAQLQSRTIGYKEFRFLDPSQTASIQGILSKDVSQSAGPASLNPNTRKFIYGISTDGPASKPRYGYDVYPIDYDPAERDKGYAIPTNRDILQDIVFSIELLNPQLVAQHRLQEIRIIVPLGSPKMKTSSFLTHHYKGPGATMMSNLRFNILIELDDTSLHLRLIPRASDGKGVYFQKAKDVSFILSLVKVNEYDGERYVFFDWIEKYYGLEKQFTGKIAARLFQSPRFAKADPAAAAGAQVNPALATGVS
ncbi:hypothetical protein ABW19_dt0205715 [Dactylella cylindrospora]|nr:hypothetical protein ABW19_dt0205715 [Dactylella cylindrospora]